MASLISSVPPLYQPFWEVLRVAVRQVKHRSLPAPSLHVSPVQVVHDIVPNAGELHSPTRQSSHSAMEVEPVSPPVLLPASQNVQKLVLLSPLQVPAKQSRQVESESGSWPTPQIIEYSKQKDNTLSASPSSADARAVPSSDFMFQKRYSM